MITKYLLQTWIHHLMNSPNKTPQALRSTRGWYFQQDLRA